MVDSVVRAAALLFVLCVAGTTSLAQDPQRPVVLPAARAPALLAELSLEEKAGQLFMCWVLAKEAGQEPARAALEATIRDVGIGGVIVSLGTMGEAAALVERLQGAAKVPLLMAGDFENGLAFRFSDATDLGPNMLVGATGSDDLAFRAGQHTGAGAKALGFHWAFAPVLDINNNPSNPIINVRSYGEDPALVARLGAAFARGVQSAGVLACGKHFPGHGNVATDSHLGLATVPGTREQLMAGELHPFAVAIKQGLGGVMTGHLAVPGLGEDPAVPATLSRTILHGLLREEFGFGGIIVTDALDMGGVKNALPPGEVAVRALLAGADMLLMPPEPVVARDAVVAAVRSGRLSQARLDDAVGRILAVKERYGALDQERAASDPAPAGVNPELAAEIARRGVTLVRDTQGLVPLATSELATAPPMEPVLVIDVLDKAVRQSRDESVATVLGASLDGAVRHLVVHGGSEEAAIERATEALAKSAVVVVNFHIKVRAFSGSIAVPAPLRPLVRALAQHDRAIAVSFGNPYLLSSFPDVSTYICAFGATPATERAVALALLGAEGFTGRLPVGIPVLAPAGTGLQRVARDDARWDAVRARLQRAVEERVFPGAVFRVERWGTPLAEFAVGRETYADGAPAMTVEHTFDLASLTKVCATLPVVLALVQRGVATLDTPVCEQLPAFRGGGRELVTLRHLLTHSSGLPAWRSFYSEGWGKDEILRAALATNLEVKPGQRTRYSDVGLMVLMAWVEKAAGTDFDHAVQRMVFDPLGMAGARFNSTDAPLPHAVPTEVVPQRGGAVRGMVHDENAWALGGVSGHAGLFATAADVAKLGAAFLAGGRPGAEPWLDRALVAEAVRRQKGAADGGGTRCLGWDRPAAGGWAGTEVPAGLFAHTGFTGTSVWCDPTSGLCAVLLTNRVHPTRKESRHTAVRREVHDLLQR